jgi:hypothetical protein
MANKNVTALFGVHLISKIKFEKYCSKQRSSYLVNRISGQWTTTLRVTVFCYHCKTSLALSLGSVRPVQNNETQLQIRRSGNCLLRNRMPKFSLFVSMCECFIYTLYNRNEDKREILHCRYSRRFPFKLLRFK